MSRKKQPTVGTASTGTINQDQRVDEAPIDQDQALDAEAAADQVLDAAAQDEDEVNDPTPPAEAETPADPAPTPAAEAMDIVVAAQTARVRRVARSVLKTEARPTPDTVLFVSSQPEPEAFSVRIGTEDRDELAGRWDNTLEHLVWRVPVALVERFERHSFVQTGRIVRAS